MESRTAKRERGAGPQSQQANSTAGIPAKAGAGWLGGVCSRVGDKLDTRHVVARLVSPPLTPSPLLPPAEKWPHMCCSQDDLYVTLYISPKSIKGILFLLSVCMCMRVRERERKKASFSIPYCCQFLPRLPKEQSFFYSLIICFTFVCIGL